jgi:hypothetical protein
MGMRVAPAGLIEPDDDEMAATFKLFSLALYDDARITSSEDLAASLRQNFDAAS